MSLGPSLATLRARIGAYSLHAKYDSSALTERARAAFFASFEAKVDPERKLAPAERTRRAEAARRAHFARLALKSVVARRKSNLSGLAFKRRRPAS